MSELSVIFIKTNGVRQAHAARMKCPPSYMHRRVCALSDRFTAAAASAAVKSWHFIISGGSGNERFGAVANHGCARGRGKWCGKKRGEKGMERGEIAGEREGERGR